MNSWKQLFWIAKRYDYNARGYEYYLVIRKGEQFSTNMTKYTKLSSAIRAAKNLHNKEMNKVDGILLGDDDGMA
jgi:hypothetical protein